MSGNKMLQTEDFKNSKKSFETLLSINHHFNNKINQPEIKESVHF